MKPAAASIFKPRALAISATAMLAAAAAVFATSVLQNSEPLVQPVLAERAIVFPDGHAIQAQKYEVTIAEWNICHEDGGCAFKLRPPAGKAATDIPATGLNHEDVIQFLAWINSQSDSKYRLPTFDEWQYMARDVLPEKPDPIFTDPELRWASAYLTEGIAPRGLKPVGSFSTSAEGVADLDGSVWEWTDDCYAGESGEVVPELCAAYYVGGEHLAVIPYLVADPARGGCAVGTPPAHLGFRLVLDELK